MRREMRITKRRNYLIIEYSIFITATVFLFQNHPQRYGKIDSY